MDKKEIVSKVLNKLGVTLTPQTKKELKKLIEDIRKADKEGVIKVLMAFKERLELTDEQLGEVMNRVVDSKVFMDGEQRNEDKVKELKKITDHPPIKIYFDRIY